MPNIIINIVITILADANEGLIVTIMITVRRSEKLKAKPHLNIGLANPKATVSPAASLLLNL